MNKLKEVEAVGSPIIGTMKYYDIEDWDEYKMTRLTDLKYLTEIYKFIESSV